MSLFHILRIRLLRVPSQQYATCFDFYHIHGTREGQVCVLCMRQFSAQRLRLSSPNRVKEYFRRVLSFGKNQKEPPMNETEEVKTESELLKDQLLLTVEPDKAERFEKMRNKILDYSGSFLEQYSKDLHIITRNQRKAPEFVKKQKPNLPEALTTTKLKSESSEPAKGKKRNYSSEVVARRFLLYGKGTTTEPVYTKKFEDCKRFLLSQNILPYELEFYPDIQRMSNNDILDSVHRLKDEGIQVVYSLFLIQRMYEEIRAEQESGVPLKGPKFKNGLTRVRALQYVKKYLHLCELVETPDLDPLRLLENCVEKDVTQQLHKLINQIESLIALGASGKEILKNLSVLKNVEQKLKLYKQSNAWRQDSSFPYDLFSAPTFQDFQTRLTMESTIDSDLAEEVARELGITILEFKSYVGHRKLKYLHHLAEKIKMCYSVGISQQDIITNLRAIDRYPFKKFHTAIKVFNTSGFPASVHLLSVIIENGEEENGVKRKKRKNKDELLLKESEDSETIQVQDPTSISTKRNDTNPKRGDYSARKTRRVLFKAVQERLSLPSETLTHMFRCNVDIELTHLTDVAKNLDFLTKQGFTYQQLSQCPLVLVHPYTKLIETVRTTKAQITNQLNASFVSSTTHSLSHPHEHTYSLNHDSSSFYHHHTHPDVLSDVRDGTSVDNPESYPNFEDENYKLTAKLLNDPILFLNTVQYLIEKENNFSGCSDHRIRKTI